MPNKKNLSVIYKKIKSLTPSYQAGVADFTSLGMTGGMGPNKKGVLKHNAFYKKPIKRPIEMFEGGAQYVKPIEVEKDELIFEKGRRGDFKLKADFKGGRTHEEGGEPYLSQEGDIIFPANQREKVLKEYREGDHATLEKMRMRLPKDKPGGTGKAQAGLQVGTNLLQNALNLAPSIYNVGKSLFDKPVRTQRRYYEPKPIDPYVNIQPQLRDISQAEKLRFEQARNLGGGSTGRTLSDMRAAAAQSARSRGDLRTQKQAIERDLRNRNIAEQNRAGQVNLELANRYDDLDLQNEARKQEFLAKGLEGTSAYSQTRERSRRQDDMIRSLNEQGLAALTSYLDSTPYELRQGEGGQWGIYYRGSNRGVPDHVAQETISEVDLNNGSIGIKKKYQIGKPSVNIGYR